MPTELIEKIESAKKQWAAMPPWMKVAVLVSIFGFGLSSALSLTSYVVEARGIARDILEIWRGLYGPIADYVEQFFEITLYRPGFDIAALYAVMQSTGHVTVKLTEPAYQSLVLRHGVPAVPASLNAVTIPLQIVVAGLLIYSEQTCRIALIVWLVGVSIFGAFFWCFRRLEAVRDLSSYMRATAITQSIVATVLFLLAAALIAVSRGFEVPLPPP